MMVVSASCKPIAMSGDSLKSDISGLHFFLSCLIGQTLPDHAFERDLGPLHIVDAEFGTGVLAKVELGQIAIKVLRVHVLINADQPALEDREEALQRVHMHVAARPFILGMINAFVLCDGREFVVLRAIGNEPAILMDVLIKKAADASMVEDHGPDIAATLGKTQNECMGLLALRTTLGLTGISQGGFIRFDGFTRAAQGTDRIGGHGFPDPMAEEPCGFHAAIEHPLNLPSGDAFLAGAHQVDDLQPEMQRQVGGLEDSSYSHREGLLAGVALAETGARGLAVQAADLHGFTAMSADRASGPQRGFHIGESCGFILEVRGGKDGLGHGDISYDQNTRSWGQVCQV
jgi:hypothetical protein